MKKTSKPFLNSHLEAEPPPQLSQALATFAPLALRERLFVRGRLWTAPLLAVCARVPGGLIADVGCGHGVISALLAAGRADRTLIGIDPDPRKIAFAQRGPGRLPNASFRRGDLEALLPELEGRLDAVVVVDVLYLVPPRSWGAFLGSCRKLLKAGGMLLLKETEANGSWKHWKCLAQEVLMVKILRRTKSSGSLRLIPRAQAQTLLEEHGFQVLETADLSKGYTTPHVLFSARAC